MTSQTDVKNAAAPGATAPETTGSVHPNFGRITTTGAGDPAVAAELQRILDGRWAGARESTRASMTPDML
ncbi:MAG TPA: acyl-CoA oxidase, partial [Dietzia sp.]|nr:acyl-CoA oxidase [Dietzia sp.]